MNIDAEQEGGEEKEEGEEGDKENSTFVEVQNGRTSETVVARYIVEQKPQRHDLRLEYTRERMVQLCRIAAHLHYLALALACLRLAWPPHMAAASEELGAGRVRERVGSQHRTRQLQCRQLSR